MTQSRHLLKKRGKRLPWKIAGFIFCFLSCSFLSSGSIAQTITIVAGDGTWGRGGDGGAATAAQLNQPIAVTIDRNGNMYIVDAGNDNIRKVTSDGIIATIAGKRDDGTNGLGTDDYILEGIAATQALIWKPHDIATDLSGNIVFPEATSGVIRKISSAGIISTISGNPPKFRYKTSEDLAVNTALGIPNGITIDSKENIFFTDEKANRVYKIGKRGVITTIAGNGDRGDWGDGELATYAELNKPWGVATDEAGNVYIADRGNNRVRKISVSGIITTVAGNGSGGYSGDGGPATNATLNEPHGIAVDKEGNIYVADAKNDAVRLITPQGIITTFAGNGKRLYHGDDGIKSSIVYARNGSTTGNGGAATSAQLFWPMGVAVDSAGDVYIADDHNHVIRKVTVPRDKKATDTALNTHKDTLPVPSYPEKEKHSADTFNITVDAGRKLLIIAIDPLVYTSFTVTDKKSKVLIQQELKEIQTAVDISKLIPGQYYLNLKNNERIKTVRFIIED